MKHEAWIGRSVVSGVMISTSKQASKTHSRGILLAVPLVAAFAIASTGCVGPRANLTPEQAAMVNKTVVQSYFPKNEPWAQYEAANSSGQGGLIEAIIVLIINNSQHKKAEKRVQPLRDQTQDVDFRAMYWQAISNEVCNVPWLKVESFETFPTEFSGSIEKIDKSAAVLAIKSSFSMRPDCRVMEIASSYDFYLPGDKRKVAAMNSVSYYSPLIGRADGEKAITLWTNHSAKAYRWVLTNSVEDSAKLLRYALTLMGSSNSPAITRRPATVRGQLWGRGESKLTGSILEEPTDRIFFLNEKDGRIYSFPSGKATVTYLTKTGTAPAPSVAQSPRSGLSAIFAEINDSEIAELCEALKSDKTGEVVRALKELRQMEAPAAVPHILPCLTNADPGLVRDACRTLAVLGTKDVIPSIEPLLNHARSDVRKDAQNAINALRTK